MVTRQTVAVLVLVVLSVLAGCGQRSPEIDTNIDVVDQTDADCDGRFSQVTLEVTVDFWYVPDGFFSRDPFLVVDYATGSGGTNQHVKIDSVESSGINRTLTVRIDDINAGQETRFSAELRSPGLLSSDVIRSDSTEWVAVESAAEDRPKLEARFEYEPSKPRPNQSVRLTGFDAESGGCGVSAYRWDLDADGETDARGQNVTHRFHTDGYHDVVLNVTTSRGVTDSVTQDVFVFHDPDADGVTSAIERKRGTDPHNADTDGDLFLDGIDPAPTTLLVPTGAIHIALTVALYLGGVRYRSQIQMWLANQVDQLRVPRGRIRPRVRDLVDRVRQLIDQLR